MNIGIIGAGSICEYHIGAYLKNENCTVKAIADVNIANAKQRAEQFNIKKIYDDYKKLLEDEEIDAVSILTPTFTHKQIIIDALKKEKMYFAKNLRHLMRKKQKNVAKLQKNAENFLCLVSFADSEVRCNI